MKKIILLTMAFFFLNKIRGQELVVLTNTYVSAQNVIGYEKNEVPDGRFSSKMPIRIPKGLTIYIYFRAINLNDKMKCHVKIGTEKDKNEVLDEGLNISTKLIGETTVLKVISEKENIERSIVDKECISLVYQVDEEKKSKTKYVSVYLTDNDNKELAKFYYQLK